MAERQIADNTMIDEDEINLLDYWRVLVKRKLLIGIIVGAAFVVSIIYSLILPPIYASTASIFPPQQEGSMSGIASLHKDISMRNREAGQPIVYIYVKKWRKHSSIEELKVAAVA